MPSRFGAKRLFGACIIANERRAEDAGAARLQRNSRGRGRAGRRFGQRSLLEKPDESWSLRIPGLPLILDPDAKEYETCPSRVKYFRYRLDYP